MESSELHNSEIVLACRLWISTSTQKLYILEYSAGESMESREEKQEWKEKPSENK